MKKLVTLLIGAAVGLGISMSGASAACSEAKLKGAWKITWGLAVCPATMDAKGKFAKSICKTSSLGSAAGLALNDIGKVVAQALVESDASAQPYITGDINVSSSCLMSGTITLTGADSKKYPMTVRGRLDSDVNMFVATGEYKSSTSPLLLMLGGYRN